MKPAQAEVIIAPNPAHNREMAIRITGTGQVAASVSLSDATGRVLLRQERILNSQPVTFLPELRPGIYMLAVRIDGKTTNHKLVIH